ncbi:MAG: UbiA family prenyltransferase [Thermoplasmata archaeon]
MRGYLRLIRPVNCVMSAVGCLLGSYVAVGSTAPLDLLLALQAAAIALLFTAGGNSLNDYYDRDVDGINHPDRPIPSGSVSPRGALAMAAILFAPTIPWSLFIRWELLVLVLINLALMSSYEVVFKREGFRGNMLISWLVSSLFIFGGLAVYEGSIEALQRVLFLALLAFLATLGREVIKDIEDVTGDVGRRTLPMRLGETGAGRVASLSLLLAVGLSAVPATLGVLSIYYLFTVLGADAMFIYAALNSSRRPATARRAAKYGMLIALLAFLVGGFP